MVSLTETTSVEWCCLHVGGADLWLRRIRYTPLLVFGPERAVEEVIASAGLIGAARRINLSRFWSRLRLVAEGVNSFAEMYASSGRWLKLTPESAALLQQQDLIETATKGIRYAVVGKPGKVSKWLTVESGSAALNNPALWTGVSGFLAQLAMQQQLDEIKGYLVSIESKLDDVLRKVDETQIAELVGIGGQIDMVIIQWEESGTIDDDIWSTVAQAPAKIGTARDYALRQLDAIVTKLKVPAIKKLAKDAHTRPADVSKWLGVLAYCYQKQYEIDMIQLERKFATSAETEEHLRTTLSRQRDGQHQLIRGKLESLEAALREVVSVANEKRFWHHRDSALLVQSADDVAEQIHRFSSALALGLERTTHGVRQLTPALERTSKGVQKAQDQWKPLLSSVGLATVAALYKARKR